MYLHPVTRVRLGNVAAIFWPTEADFSVCRGIEGNYGAGRDVRALALLHVSHLLKPTAPLIQQ